MIYLMCNMAQLIFQNIYHMGKKARGHFQAPIFTNIFYEETEPQFSLLKFY